MREILLFTDGACSGNPGPGGWAYLLRDLASGKERRRSGAEPETTNNRMELLSAIRGLEDLKEPARVTLVTDSNYVRKGIEEWMAGWKANGWRRRDGKRLVPVKNAELWQELDELIARHRVRCEWIRGHAGHPENEECDRMAVAAYQALLGNGAPSRRNPPGAGAPRAAADSGSLFDPAPEKGSIRFSQRVHRSGPAPISYLMEQGVANPGILSLAAGLVDQESLPTQETMQAVRSLLSDPVCGKSALQYGTSEGHRSLREQVVRHLAELDNASPQALGLDAGRVLVGTGSQQLLYLVAEVLLDPGDIVLVGAPGYFVYMGALESFGVRMIGIETDQNGLLPDKVEETLARLERERELGRVKFLYDVSYFNNPTGLCLSEERRGALVDVVKRWSKQQRIFLLEDAAYRELRYGGGELPSLLRFDPEGEHVLYAGTFSKPFAPGLKCGYLVAPEPLVAPIVQQKGHHDFGSANFSQAILSEVLANGGYRRHLERLRTLYARKMAAMLGVLREMLGGAEEVSWTIPEGGLYVWLTLPPKIETTRGGAFFERCLKAGVLYVPGEFCYPASYPRIPRHQLRLSFGALPIERIEEGVRRLAAEVRRLL